MMTRPSPRSRQQRFRCRPCERFERCSALPPIHRPKAAQRKLRTQEAQLPRLPERSRDCSYHFSNRVCVRKPIGSRTLCSRSNPRRATILDWATKQIHSRRNLSEPALFAPCSRRLGRPIKPASDLAIVVSPGIKTAIAGLSLRFGSEAAIPCRPFSRPKAKPPHSSALRNCSIVFLDCLTRFRNTFVHRFSLHLHQHRTHKRSVAAARTDVGRLNSGV